MYWAPGSALLAEVTRSSKDCSADTNEMVNNRIIITAVDLIFIPYSLSF